MSRNTHAPGQAPLWLIGLILFVVLWLGVKIVGNVTESLTGMVHGSGTAAVVVPARG